jgi:serine/threonine-protein kinase
MSARASDGGQFLPGQIVAERYRMVGLLGRGGMGEVYRADDLKLGQPVALKFLPRDVEHNRERLDRFLTEVRLSLRVTHPNVCRVFDVSEVDGRHFISMEYVDGEDLASLLRRIGRLPEDKAVEIARQLCAGLAAAHDEGVLHRDLKPANVMIDGRGRAKITDFGLAGATAGIAGQEARAGTPQYMAPEQFTGRELTPQTDLYSLGLVLYEIFTGKRAFDSGDALELASMHATTPASPSAHLTGLNPIVERAILRCVDPDPAGRPRSASSLAASLPGGDPLAMAIAAGETPSPEMVARSGGRGELKPAVAVVCLVLALTGLAGSWVWEQRTGEQNLMPLPKAPEELRASARTILAAVGVNLPRSDLYGFWDDSDYFDNFVKEHRTARAWKLMASASPAPLYFWYRESPSPMTPVGSAGRLGRDNPPLTEPGMARVEVDPVGKLIELDVIPPDHVAAGDPRPEPAWAPLFSLAGFTLSEWTPTEPTWTPPMASDVRRAWTRGALTVEAASFQGTPVRFVVIPSWRKNAAARIAASGGNVFWVTEIVAAILIVAAVLLARRNIRLGRSDRRGAFRLAVAYAVLGATYQLIALPEGPGTLPILSRNIGHELSGAVIVWLFYVALEPHVRRLWPGTLVAWSRLIDGQFRDPMVGRHVLIGVICGVVATFMFDAGTILSLLFGTPVLLPDGNLIALADARARLAEILASAQASFMLPVGFLLLLLVLRVLFRKSWLANAALVAFAALWSALFSGPWTERLFFVVVFVVMMTVVTRLGLLAMCVLFVVSDWSVFNLTTDPSSWFFPTSVVTMLFFTAIVVYAFVISLGGQRVFTSSVLGE